MVALDELIKMPQIVDDWPDHGSEFREGSYCQFLLRIQSLLEDYDCMSSIVKMFLAR